MLSTKGMRDRNSSVLRRLCGFRLLGMCVCSCEGVKVSGKVTSHVRHRPRAHGMSDTPSGRFPSVQLRPTGSLVDGICARCFARHTVSSRRPWMAALTPLACQAMCASRIHLRHALTCVGE
jgi:hypothetical protein